jgi:hypothetical protein
VRDDADLRAELERVDDPVYAEYPGGWADWNQAEAEAQFRRLVETLAARLGCPVRERFPALNDPDYARVRERTLCYETGIFIQDASFHGQILVPRVFMTPEALQEDYSTCLRTSNFGHLATLYDDDTDVQPAARETIVRVVEELGYTYVPTRVLNRPYTGQNRGLDGFATWGARYFEWI